MDRAEAFAAVKASFEEAIQSLSISPEPSFLTEHATLAAEKCLSVKQRQINDEEFAALLRSLQRDTYFLTLDVSSNLITNLGARELANVISAGYSALHTVILENNLIKDKGGEDIEHSKATAFSKSGRKWVVLARGNPMSEEVIGRLKMSQLDLQQSRRASVAESLPSIKDTSPIQRTSPPIWKPFERRSLASDEIFDGEMHVSDLKQEPVDVPRVDLAELTEGASDSEVANYRSRELVQIPVQLTQSLTVRRLALGCNRIVKIENLPESIEALELKKNLIVVIAGLEGLTMLRYLDLSENKLTGISGLESNLALRELSLASNNIKQVSGLEHLRELRRLNLANNNISGFMSIRTVSMNVQLKMLILQGNPLFLQAKYKASVCNLLPRLVLLDFIPVFSWKNESFSKSQGKMPFFSIDFGDTVPDSARTKVTPRFPDRQLSSTTRRNPLYVDIPETDADPFAQTRPKTTTRAKPWVPRLKRPAANHTMQVGTEVQTPVPHKAQKSTSVHTTYFLPEETDGPYPLSNKEKEDAQRQLRNVTLFRGIAGEVFRVMLETAERQHAFKGDVIQEGDVIVSRMFLILRGKVQWKSTVYGQWATLFVESLVVPVEAEDTVVSLETTDYIAFERSAVAKVLGMYPESKDVFYRNYDNIQLAAEKPMFFTPESPSYASTKKLLIPSSKRSPLSQSSQVPKINLKQLVKSETSQSLGLTTISTDPRSIRAQIDIEKLLTSDPLRPELDSHRQTPAVIDSSSDWKEAVKSLEEHISGLMSFYQRETKQERDKQVIDEEAKEFVVKGPVHTFEFMALHRPALRECVEQAFMIPMSESISEIKPEGWIEEYVSILSRDEDEAMKQTLDSWLLSLHRDIEMCILALSNILLVGKDETLISSNLTSYKDVVDELDLTEIRSNPKEYLSSFCGERVNNPDIAEKVRQITDIADKCNYCKECLDRLTAAVDSKDTATVEALQAELVQEGVLGFSLLPSQLFLTKKKKHPESSELKARVWIRQSQAMSPDSSVTSGVSSRGDLC